MTSIQDPTSPRITNLDLIKGLIMVIMALDHVRDYFHFDAFLYDPGDPIKSNLPVFFTRWITHFCAPAFSFLAGLSAFFVGRKKSKGQLSRFLFTRGIWLIVIEIVVVNFGWFFDFQYHTIGLLTIWALGCSMVFLSLMVLLPLPLIVLISVTIIFGHNLLDGPPTQNNLYLSVLHSFQFYQISEFRQIFSGYPLIPWVAVMSFGYCFGIFYNVSFTTSNRTKWFSYMGIGALLLFFILTSTNFYGDLTPFYWKSDLKQNIIDFFNPAKYPPSLQFLLMTLGTLWIVMAMSESWKGKWVDFLSVFGRVPFFYYILHIYLIHILALFAASISGFGWKSMILHNWIGFVTELKGYGYQLPMVYLIWLIVVMLLFPVCKWYDHYKQNHKDKWWLSYL